jgi:23S rRNA pseudouridine2604 synthase
MDEGIRLAKRLAEQAGCSRAEAERYIAGGWVSVDGAVVEEPATRVTPAQEVVLLPGATAIEPLPVTIVVHKPAGMDGEQLLTCIGPETQEGKERFLRRHLHKATLTNALEPEASGLVVVTQDFRVARKLVEEGERVEQEFVAEVGGTMADGGLPFLNRGAIKVSWQSDNRLRFAGKGIKPGQIGQMCRSVGLEIVALRRLRIGRVSLAGLPVGRWRYLNEFERF